MRACVFFGAVIVFLSVLTGCKGASAQVANNPLPSTAIQAKTWTSPKTSVPTEFVGATKFLLERGFGDPRGCEYRTAKIKVRYAGGYGQPIPIHGWVDGSKKVLAWDGLVYESVTIGQPADLKKDVVAAVADPSPDSYDPFGWSEAETAKIRQESGAALLLVAGETGLAEKLWTKISANRNAGEVAGMLGFNFTRKRMDRATVAFIAGDDKAAYIDASQLVAQTRELGNYFTPLLNQHSTSGSGNPAHREFVSLDLAATIAQDAARRIRRGSKAPDLKAISSMPGQDRIAALIDALDEVGRGMASGEGYPGPADSPIVQALVKEGNSAVEPLLDAFETDSRISRIGVVGRSRPPYVRFVPVKNVIYAAIRETLDTYQFTDDPYGVPTAAALRAYWKSNEGKTAPERWYAILLDDKADRRQWQEAAMHLAEPLDMRHRGPNVTLYGRKAGQAAKPMKGEALRGTVSPSITELVARRATEVAGVGKEAVNGDFECSTGLQIGLSLADWDPKGSLPTLRLLSQRARDVLAVSHNSEFVLPWFAQITTSRIQAGDSSAWADYEPVIVNQSPRGGPQERILEPLYKFPDDPSSIRLAERLFTEPTSMWIQHEWKGEANGRVAIVWAVDSPWLRIPAFRAAILRLMDDKSKLGDVTIRGKDVVAYAKIGGGNFGQVTDDIPKPGETRPLRFCDFVAQEFRNLKGAPAFRVYWPAARKDAVIAKLKQYLKTIDGKVDEALGFRWQFELKGYVEDPRP